MKINKVFLRGRLTADPELKTSARNVMEKNLRFCSPSRSTAAT